MPQTLFSSHWWSNPGISMSNEPTIICPECKTEVRLSESLTARLFFPQKGLSAAEAPTAKQRTDDPRALVSAREGPIVD